MCLPLHFLLKKKKKKQAATNHRPERKWILQTPWGEFEMELYSSWSCKWERIRTTPWSQLGDPEPKTQPSRVQTPTETRRKETGIVLNHCVCGHLLHNNRKVMCPCAKRADAGLRSFLEANSNPCLLPTLRASVLGHHLLPSRLQPQIRFLPVIQSLAPYEKSFLYKINI